MSHLFTLCRGVSFQKRSKPCCTTGRIFPVHTSLVWSPVIDPSHSLPSPHNACPPQLFQEGQTPIFTPHDEVPRGLLQTILDTSTVGTKGPTHMHVFSQDIRRMVAEMPVDMRTREDTDDFPIPFQVLWMTRFLWRKNNCGIGY
jgi:hypothetical protein